jgi:SAM-dependent methyltransferase
MLKRLLRALHKPIYDRRLETLSELFVSFLRPGDRVLDVGCGFGALGKAMLDHPRCPSGVTVEGIERAPRGDELITVHRYPGGRLPFDDGAYDAVVVADVLHHDRTPDLLLRECARVAKRIVIVKDHKPEGILGYQRICFLDWAANHGYDVPCLYRYPTLAEWRDQFSRLPAPIETERLSLDIYPPGWNSLFGKRLHYVSVLDVA